MSIPARLSRLANGDLLRHIPFHTFFLATSPIVSLLAFNIDQIYAIEALNSLLVSLLLSTVVLCLLRIFCRNWQLAGLLTSLLVIWFFLYGHLYALLKSISVFGFVVGRHRYLLVIWTLIIIAMGLWLIKRSLVNQELTMILNISSIILIALPAIQISSFLLRYQPPTSGRTEDTFTPIISWTEDELPPDIYYIILDEYARSDVLEDVFGIDNSAFLTNLQEMGFYIAECAQSNYSRTLHSLTSLFNMEYVQTLTPGVEPDANPSLLLPYLHQNVVRKQLEGLGYRTILFKNPLERYLWDNADIVYESSGVSRLSPFEHLLLRTTVARVYLDVQIAETRQLSNYTYYEDTLYTLRQLYNVPDIPGPKFVFAHLIIPHPPYVFGPNGEKIDIPYIDDVGHIYTEADSKRGTVAAVTYINKRMLEIIPNLIQASKTEPIIIIAGDHGTPWGSYQNEVKILAAFFTPGSQSPFYRSITPVNIFRVIFNTYFNSNLDLLPDSSYRFTKKGRFDYDERSPSCVE